MVGPRVQRWREGGEYVELADSRIFVARREGTGVPIVVVHGYPGSSYDFAGVVERLDRPVLLLDLLGYGFSAKPRAASYSLFEQADLVEALVAWAGLDECALVGHDMGTTVVAELLRRHNAGRLGFGVAGVVLLNGSIFIDLARADPRPAPGTAGRRPCAAVLVPGRLPASQPAREHRPRHEPGAGGARGPGRPDPPPGR